jgi:cell division septal protein FtsQ
MRLIRFGRWLLSKKGRKWLVAAILIMVAQNVLAVREVKVEAPAGEQNLAVKRLAQDYLKKQVIPANLLTVNTRRMGESMLSAEPRLKDVAIKRAWPDGLNIKVTTKHPALVWQSGEQRFVLDSDGTLIGYGDQIKLTVVVDTTGLPVKVGDRVVPAKFVQFCTSMAAGLPRLGIKVVSMAVFDTTSEVEIKTDKGYVLKLDTTRDAASQLQDLESVLMTLSKLRKVPQEYIDLRVERKAYYR